MKFIKIKDKNQWNNFITNSSSTDVLQIWEWGELKRIEGWEPLRFAVIDDEENILFCSQVLVKKVPFCGYLVYIPHGIVGKSVDKPLKTRSEEWITFETGLLEWAEKIGVFTIEVEPKMPVDTPLTKEWLEIISKNWSVTGRNRQPKYKLFIDLKLEEEEILANMQKSTRYNVRYAKKHGVEVKKYELKDSCIESKMDIFYSLMLGMQKRAGGYPIRSREYFDKLVEIFKDTNNVCLFEASYKGEVVAMNFSFFTNTWSSSFYAASNRKYPKVKAPYLLRWESILEAKNRGCLVYDFWGIVPNSDQHKGYSDHKLSFGGYRQDYIGIIEYRLNWRANILPALLFARRLFIDFKRKILF